LIRLVAGQQLEGLYPQLLRQAVGDSSCASRAWHDDKASKMCREMRFLVL
jgi:hypothetical protein